MKAKRLWTEEYRPKKIDDYIFQIESQKSQILKMIKEKEIPHLLLSGVQGSGKTTLAEILINEIEVDEFDILKINASDKTGIDYIRDNILTFAETCSFGKFKIVHLEEFDYMSQAAQGMLRVVLEEHADICRFIATCNNENRIIPAIKSRMQHLRFKAPIQDDVLLRMFEILTIEGIEFEAEDVEKYVIQSYPDIRKVINNLQLNSVDGKLILTSGDSDGDFKIRLFDLIIDGNLQEIRKLVIKNCTPEQLEEVYEFLYQNIHKHPKFKGNEKALEQAFMILLDSVYKNSTIALPYLNFEVACINLINSIE